MKRCQKLPEPTSLTTYRNAHPDSTWDEMREDAFDNGQQAYIDIKRTLVKGQRCLCAFCEIHIADGTDDESLHQKNHLQRVEHLHSKRDSDDTTNWTLKWANVWAVCLGGSQPPPDGKEHNATRYLPPLPQNLSCDTSKEYHIKKGKLPVNLEGYILAPDEIPAFPPLFKFGSDGMLKPHLENCASVTIPNNQYECTAELVSKTIEYLNLNCPRLTRSRKIYKSRLEKRIRKARQLSPGIDPQIVLLNLARRLFSQHSADPWPEFFSLIRDRLSEAAEERLREIGYDG